MMMMLSAGGAFDKTLRFCYNCDSQKRGLNMARKNDVQWAWVTARLPEPDRAALERVAADRFDGNVSQALRYCVRLATSGKHAPKPTRQAAGVTG